MTDLPDWFTAICAVVLVYAALRHPLVTRMSTPSRAASEAAFRAAASNAGSRRVIAGTSDQSEMDSPSAMYPSPIPGLQEDDRSATTSVDGVADDEFATANRIGTRTTATRTATAARTNTSARSRRVERRVTG